MSRRPSSPPSLTWEIWLLLRMRTRRPGTCWSWLWDRSRLARLDRALCSPPRPASFTSLKLLWERLRWMRLWRPHSSWSGSRHRPE